MKSIDERQELEAQVVHILCLDIGRGALRPGDALPAPEELARQLLVNPRKVAAAYERLAAAGVAEGAGAEACTVSSGGPERARAWLVEEFRDDLASRLRELRGAGCDLCELRRAADALLQAPQPSPSPAGPTEG